jgi:CheY-like chemotaxis protein
LTPLVRGGDATQDQILPEPETGESPAGESSIEGNRPFTEAAKISAALGPGTGLSAIGSAPCLTESGSALMPRVLVVDDQANVRTMLSIVLRVHRFDIVEAANAEAALRAFEDYSSFDLAIVDIFLQGTNGVDLITMMRERVPALPVVAISGITALDFVSQSPELGDVVCLQKPFRPNELIDAITQACARRRHEGSAIEHGAAV